MIHQHSKKYKIGNIETSEKEIRDLIKAWVIISIAFGIVLSGSLFSAEFLSNILLAALTVGIGFLIHELSHKVVAQKYGCFAEFRSFDQMLFLALIMSFFGFVFAAPGAVMISGPVGLRRNGKISVAGPVSNLVLAIFFASLLLIPVTGLLSLIARYGFLINTWLALFNMLPFGNFDGKKILAWNKVVYGIVVGLAFIFMLAQGYLFAL